MNQAELKGRWQAEGDTPPPALQTVRGDAAAFHRTVQRRNWIEYAAVLFVVAAFAVQAWFEPNLVVRIGEVFCIAGALYVGWQLRARTTPKPAPVAPTLREALDHLHTEYVRQHHALVHVWDWYILPLVPGMALILIGRNLALEAHKPGLVGGIVAASVMIAVLYAVWRLNRRAAAKLKLKIEDIESMRKELE